MDQIEEESSGLLDPVLLGEIVRRLSSTDIDELEVSDGSSRLYVRRRGVTSAELPGTVARSEPAADGVAVTAPLTGVFYARPAPDQPVFVDVGAFVEVDDVVALIETMKLFNEVKSDLAGRVTEIAARDGDLVEAGQPLLFVAQSPMEE